MLPNPRYSPEPSVSVIVPVYNEAQYIERCLNAILDQNYPAEQVEILVVDGGSTDDTRRIIRRLQEVERRIRLLDNPEKLQAHALNRGLDVAKGEIIIRVDGHTLLERDYISTCVHYLRQLADRKIVNVGGMMRPCGETPAGRAIAAATSSPFGIPTAFHHSNRAQVVDTVYLGAWPRVVFDVVGRFNPSVNVNEDYELNYRLRLAGGKIFFSPGIRSIYFCRQSFRALWRQYHRYGIQKARMLKQHPASLKLRHLVAPIFVVVIVGGVVGMFLAPLPTMRTLIGLGLVLMFSLYITAGYVAAYKAPRVQVSIGAVIVAFAVIHLAWGTGFWRGLLNLVPR
jgi:succinoglycan biosynthesis protein ExoA